MTKCYCCGTDVQDCAKFCPKCGKPLEITQDLIDRAESNDSSAQTELYERTYKTVYTRIRAKVPDNDTVMDIMQETYLRAFTNLDQLQKAETFPSWLLTIANRQVCNWYQKNGKEQQNIQMSQLAYEIDDTISNEDDLLEEPEYREDFSPVESLDRAETGRLLSEILDTLPEDQRIILTMRYYDEMSLIEISEGLGVNLSTVKTRLTAGKKKVEAKVLELEKSGTKIYSLGPIPFLVYLLHHAELFAPSISANSIIGLIASGAGAGAGGAAVAHATAGAAAKTAAAVAAKGISVKVAAIVAAAVIVVGGGTTAAVVFANNTQQSSETASVESEDTFQKQIVELTHEEPQTEESETEPEFSEEPMEPDVSEEASDAGSEQQEPEPVAAEENQEEETVVPQESAVDLPSYDAVYDMLEPLSDTMANLCLDIYLANSSFGKISFNTNEAVELAGLAASNDSYVLMPDQVDASLKKLFGSQYQLSDFTNMSSQGKVSDYKDSSFIAEYPNGYVLEWLCLYDDGSFHVEYIGTDCFEKVTGIIVKSIVPNGDSTCTATVEYDVGTYSGANGYNRTYSFDILYDLIPDNSADYGWAITSVQYGDAYNVVENPG